MGQHQQLAPGMRLEIRDAEWRLTRLDHSSDGGYLLGCSGLSELVRGREAQFLSRLEDDIRILHPATTELIDGLSQERTEYGIALGWEEGKDLQEGVVRKTYLDDTLPDGPWETIIEYHAPLHPPRPGKGLRGSVDIF
ncbi:hypothetical protein [Halomonas ramblicola]|uniref:hypothetical protein n=1 Tax=Halomonas ramblicola TaxID=747349 RepID=UPI0025B416E2|nr:hypothetical protein [Halomonas ramblicola]MDN3521987.1 hypothetical protein [Halomonas ramblicola]